MKRYIRNAAMVRPLSEEANRVYNALTEHPEVVNMKYEDETDAYCIEFADTAQDVGWIWEAMEKLGYKATGQDEDAIYWGKDHDYRAWMYEEPALELYITN